MTAPDAPQVEPLTLPLEEALARIGERGYTLAVFHHKGAPEYVLCDMYSAFARGSFGHWKDAVEAVLGRPVVPRDDTVYWRLSAHVENALAPVLGYEYDEAVGWNVGEHTAESLVMAAASRIAELVGVLQELRARFHASGRRPEECYEMSLIDEALARVKGGERS